MKLLNDFLSETRNGGCFFSDNSFVTYSQPDPEHIYIEDIYIVPHLRKKMLASQLADMVSRIGESRGCKYVMGAVDKSSTKLDTDITVLEHYGMSKWKEDDYFIYYRKAL